jgi:hypothetical protein
MVEKDYAYEVNDVQNNANQSLFVVVNVKVRTPFPFPFAGGWFDLNRAQYRELPIAYRLLPLFSEKGKEWSCPYA